MKGFPPGVDRVCGADGALRRAGARCAGTAAIVAATRSAVPQIMRSPYLSSTSWQVSHWRAAKGGWTFFLNSFGSFDACGE